MPDSPSSWRQLAGEQDGVIARHQALAAGMSRAAWDWRLARGRWTGLGEGVAVIHSGTPSPRQVAWAAVLQAGRGAALSGDAALVALGLRRVTVGTHDVAVPAGRHIAAVDVRGLRMTPHRVAHTAQWVSAANGLPVLRAHAAVLHAMAWAKSDAEAERRLAMAVQQKLTAVPLVRTALAQLPRLPRRALVRSVLDDIELGAHAQSELEFLRFLRQHGLPLPDALQVKVRAGGTRYLDGRYDRQRLSVEVDGAYHLWVETWDADALRSLHLAVAARGTGEQLIRITRANLRHNGPVVAELLRALLS